MKTMQAVRASLKGRRARPALRLGVSNEHAGSIAGARDRGWYRVLGRNPDVTTIELTRVGAVKLGWEPLDGSARL